MPYMKHVAASHLEEKIVLKKETFFCCFLVYAKELSRLESFLHRFSANLFRFFFAVFHVFSPSYRNREKAHASRR